MRTPNYNFERQERDRAKNARKAEKAEAKSAKRDTETRTQETPVEDADRQPDAVKT